MKWTQEERTEELSGTVLRNGNRCNRTGVERMNKGKKVIELTEFVQYAD